MDNDLIVKSGNCIQASSEWSNPSFVFNSNNPPEEMIRISKEGFWVRGKKIEQDELEAENVYKAFLELLGFKK